MLYHGFVAMAGVGLLLGGWLLVQRLHAGGAAAPAGAVQDAAPRPDGTGAACGACAACSPTARLPQAPGRTDELARDGPAAASGACEPRPLVALQDPTRVTS